MQSLGRYILSRYRLLCAVLVFNTSREFQTLTISRATKQERHFVVFPHHRLIYCELSDRSGEHVTTRRASEREQRGRCTGTATGYSFSVVRYSSELFKVHTDLPYRSSNRQPTIAANRQRRASNKHLVEPWTYNARRVSDRGSTCGDDSRSAARSIETFLTGAMARGRLETPCTVFRWPERGRCSCYVPSSSDASELTVRKQGTLTRTSIRATANRHIISISSTMAYHYLVPMCCIYSSGSRSSLHPRPQP